MNRPLTVQPSAVPQASHGRRPLRVAVISHAHPEHRPGGAQAASYAQFAALKDTPGIDPIYVARCNYEALGHSGPFAAFRGRPDEILWSAPGHDPFRLTSLSPDSLRRDLKYLCGFLSPDIVHIHHIIGFGTDICRMLSEEFGCRVILTLHEYLGICHHWGQMVKTDGRLCYQSSFSECSHCFPEFSSGKFFLRKQLLLEHFSHVDAFIAPSHFLRDRYLAWGLEPERIRVIENQLRVHDRAAPEKSAPPADRDILRLGYFGQLTPFKGVDVLLDAIEMLDEEVRDRVKLVIFGIDLHSAGSGNRGQIEERLGRLKGTVVNYGQYRNEDVLDLMRSVQWIVVPSIWWENSPVVIQEAKLAGVPVLGSNIGAMLEKIRPGVDGAHFMAGSSFDLAEKIVAILDGRLTTSSTPSSQSTSPTETVVECYREIMASKDAWAAADLPPTLTA